MLACLFSVTFGSILSTYKKFGSSIFEIALSVDYVGRTDFWLKIYDSCYPRTGMSKFGTQIFVVTAGTINEPYPPPPKKKKIDWT